MLRAASVIGAAPSAPLAARAGRPAPALLTTGRSGDASAADASRRLLGLGVIRAEAVGGAHERRLVGDLRGHLVHDAPAEDDDGAVAGQLDLLQLRGVEQDGRAGRGELAQEVVDLALGADVDAARGVEAEQRLDAAGDPARDGDLLLVAAREPADLALGARVDLQALDGARRTRARSRRHVDGAPAPRRGRDTAARCSRAPSAA